MTDEIAMMGDPASLIDDPMYEGIAPTFVFPEGSDSFGPFEIRSPLLLEEELMSIYKANMSEQMITDSVRDASDFFNIRMPILTFEGSTTGVMTLFKNFFFDDILMYNRDELINMGITDQGAVDLVMTHEAAHRALQDVKINNYTGSSWEEELACDFYAGVRAEMEGIDVSKFSSALESTLGGDSHPNGQLRSDFIRYGQNAANEMEALGVRPTFENCQDIVNKFLADNQYSILASHHSLYPNLNIA